MYSPKIAEDLIPRIYWTAKGMGIPMTRFVNEILTRALNALEKGGEARDEREGSSRGEAR